MNPGVFPCKRKFGMPSLLPLTVALVLTEVVGPNVALARPTCGTVKVVYADGRPVKGAEVIHHYTDPYTNQDPTGGESWVTGRDGRVCKERLLDSGFLEIYAPLALGGWCAGQEKLRYHGARPSAADAQGVTRVTLHMRWFHRVTWGGRVVSPGGHPIEGAMVLVNQVQPDGADCSEEPRRGWYTAGADGTFQFERLPKGRVDLLVEAKGYATQAFEIHVPGPPRDLQLSAGAEWSGRLVDPEGAPIVDCSMRLHHAHDNTDIKTACTPQGFAFRNIPAGEAKLYVHVGKLPWSGEGRGLMIPVQFADGEQRSEDVRWPVGLDISGVVVDESGIPVPYAYLRTASQDRERWAAEGYIETRADERGRFTIRHLASGIWELMAGRNILYGAEMSVVAGTKDVRIVLSMREKSDVSTGSRSGLRPNDH
jgi:hypothetical protein